MDIDIRDSLDRAVDQVVEWLPEFIGALFILLVGYIVAKLLQGVVVRGLLRAGFDRALERSPAGSFVARAMASPSGFVGRVAFWAVFLWSLFIAVGNLGIDVLEEFVSDVYSYLPNVVAAVAIFLVASAISAGASGLAQRVMGNSPTGRLVGTVVPVLTMGIAVFMILDQLKIAEDIVNITYTALIGSVALGLALAFGLGGRDVAARMLEQAYAAGQRQAGQVKRDVATTKRRR